MGLCLCEALEHEGDHGELGEAFGDDGDGFIVSHEAAIAAEPRECALDHPPSPDKLKAALLVGALDDLQIDRLAGQRCLELRPGITAIGEDLGDEWKESACLADQIRGAVAILNTGRNDLDTEQQSYRIDDRVALDALNFLAGVVADRIGVGPPFSVAFTDWVSMMAAVGDASRPSISRHWTSSA